MSDKTTVVLGRFVRVFICSPYRGDIQANVALAKLLCRAAVIAGFAPFAPHVFYTSFLNDKDPHERQMGIAAGKEFMAVCDEVWVYDREGISEGMEIELAHARRLGLKTVFYPTCWKDVSK